MVLLVEVAGVCVIWRVECWRIAETHDVHVSMLESFFTLLLSLSSI